MIDWTQVLIAFIVGLPATLAAAVAAVISIVNMFKNWKNAAAIEAVHGIVNSNNTDQQNKIESLHAKIAALEKEKADAAVKAAELREPPQTGR